MRLVGRVWCFGDDMNTNTMQPHLEMAPEQAAKLMFGANRPGWAAQVRPGDLLVAGRNFGTGSTRPVAKVMRELGLAAVLADSINGGFFRMCVNLAFPALAVPGVAAAFAEGDEAEIDFERAQVRNRRSGVLLRGVPWTERHLGLLRAGGLASFLDAQGLLHPEGWQPPETSG